MATASALHILFAIVRVGGMIFSQRALMAALGAGRGP